MDRVDFVSPTYPYSRVMPGALLLKDVDAIPRKIVQYLMDLPLPNYEPPCSNDYPRARLMKYLYYDEADALLRPLPTPGEKLSILYDPEHPATPPGDKGYRLYPQSYVKQSQTEAKTRLMVYMGRTVAIGSNQVELSVNFDILTSVVQENSSDALSRTFAMEQCIIEALNGVNMGGVGTFYYNRRNHGDCGSMPINDRGANVGRAVTMGISWME